MPKRDKKINIFGQLFRKHRLKKNLTFEDLSKKTEMTGYGKVSIRTLQALEINPSANPTLSTILAVTEALEIKDVIFKS